VKHLKWFQPRYGRLLALPSNIKLGWKGLPRTNTLVNYEDVYITDKKIITLAPGLFILWPNRHFHPSLIFSGWALGLKNVANIRLV
jgi:hypothetical protein